MQHQLHEAMAKNGPQRRGVIVELTRPDASSGSPFFRVSAVWKIISKESSKWNSKGAQLW